MSQPAAVARAELGGAGISPVTWRRVQLARSSMRDRLASIWFAESPGAWMLTVTDFLGSILYSLRMLRMAMITSWSLGKMNSAAWEKSPTVGQGALMRRFVGKS